MNKTRCVKTGSKWEGVPVSNTMCGRFAKADERCYSSPTSVIINRDDQPGLVCPNCADRMIEIINKQKSTDTTYIESEEYKKDRYEYQRAQEEAKKKYENVQNTS